MIALEPCVRHADGRVLASESVALRMRAGAPASCVLGIDQLRFFTFFNE